MTTADHKEHMQSLPGLHPVRGFEVHALRNLSAATPKSPIRTNTQFNLRDHPRAVTIKGAEVKITAGVRSAPKLSIKEIAKIAAYMSRENNASPRAKLQLKTTHHLIAAGTGPARPSSRAGIKKRGPGRK